MFYQSNQVKKHLSILHVTGNLHVNTTTVTQIVALRFRNHLILLSIVEHPKLQSPTQ